MIGVSEEFVPKFIKNNRKKRMTIILLIFFFLIIAGYFFIHEIRKGIHRGPDFSGLRLTLTNRLLDSCALGLNRFYNKNGHYPECNGKYFFDSIKGYVNISNVYIYRDSINIVNQVIPLKKTNVKDGYLKSSHSFVGVGLRNQYITYTPLTPSSFKLYSVGENKKDENGEGDDIVYQ